MRPGLIEARARVCARWSPGAAFQGACALASLKRSRPDRRGVGALRFLFPGRMRPGLIEAVLGVDVGGSGAMTFQGACALASLKHVASRPGVGVSATFQGACALASLKRRPSGRSGGAGGAFQGACALASLKPGHDARAAEGPGDFPGRMRPGLIEARSCCFSGRRTPDPTFQGACALASLKPDSAGRSGRAVPLSRAHAPWPH